jgi:chemotaxis response regulator CheB
LPADFGAAVVAVQHVDEAFAQGMAEWLDAQCQLPVRLARLERCRRPARWCWLARTITCA